MAVFGVHQLVAGLPDALIRTRDSIAREVQRLTQQLPNLWQQQGGIVIPRKQNHAVVAPLGELPQRL